MKYVIIIPDGGADRPLAELGGLTPFQAARMPNLQRLARSGRVGTAATTPPGFEAGSDVCTMDLLGFDPARYHTGRAPLEAAALGVRTAESDWIFRLNLVTVGEAGAPDSGLMLDHSAGGISDAEARVLVAGLVEHWKRAVPEAARGVRVTPGVSYRSILVCEAGSGGAGGEGGADYSQVRCTPPHEIPRQRWADHVPSGQKAGAEVLGELMRSSAEYLGGHEVNRARRDAGLRPANMAWIWGQGTRPRLPKFSEQYRGPRGGLRGGMITSVDLLRGIATLIGWDLIECPGLTSYHDTDYAAQGRATIRAMDDYDVVCCHVEAPDEASHQADWQTKVASLERTDEAIIGQVAGALARFGDGEREPGVPGWRLLVLPDHFTLCSTRRHDATPVPFMMAGAWVKSLVPRGFSEAEAAESDLHIERGHELMEYFLFSGLPKVAR